jgi:hypothetical protein
LAIVSVSLLTLLTLTGKPASREYVSVAAL